MSRRRVAITGLGVVGPFPGGLRGFWDGLLAGESGIRQIEVPGLEPIAAVQVDDNDRARERFGARDARRMARAGRLAALAAADAIEDAGLHDADRSGFATSIGCVHGGAEHWYDGHETLRSRGADRVGPLMVPLGLTNSPSAAISRVLDLTGPCLSVTTACAAGTDAIGLGMGMIRDGRADVVVCGGAEAPLSPLVVSGYAALGALSHGTHSPQASSRPFDTEREGFVIAEGAGILVLEDAQHAIARGARIYAEACGYGSSCDAAHLTDPHPDGAGAIEAMRIALDDAEITAADIAYVNAHATSTPVGDIAEARALRSAGLASAPVSSTKGALGHALGAAGGVEAVATVLSIATGAIPPTANLHHPDPGADLDHVTQPRTAEVPYAISNSFGFGGHNAALVFGSSRTPSP